MTCDPRFNPDTVTSRHIFTNLFIIPLSWLLTASPLAAVSEDQIRPPRPPLPTTLPSTHPPVQTTIPPTGTPARSAAASPPTAPTTRTQSVAAAATRHPWNVPIDRRETPSVKVGTVRTTSILWFIKSRSVFIHLVLLAARGHYVTEKSTRYNRPAQCHVMPGNVECVLRTNLFVDGLIPLIYCLIK